MWQDTAVSRKLGLRYPIVQGPFGGGLSSVDLLAAVSEAGGLGSFGVHHLEPAQIRDLDATIRARTNKPYALNLWVSNHDQGGLSLTPEVFAAGIERFRPYYEELGVEPPPMPARYGQSFDEQVEAVLEARPPAFSFVFGIPSPRILEECRRRGIVTIGAITTVDEAVAMEAAGVDLIVATGFEAGGHRVSFLAPAEDSLTGSFALIPTVADRVKTPVIAAGGIADGRGIAAALTLGAQGVQIGTAFLACRQSSASTPHRRMLFDERNRYTALTRVFSGRLARGIRNRFLEEMSASGVPPFPYPIQNWFTGSFRKAAGAQDRPDLMSLWAGQAAPLMRHHDATALFAELVRDASARLGPRAG
ncbi:2-nitropropane dioxygenase [Solimonas fluminis]|uniref:Propionate 3-nitronate monooxygenase n=1 Tax=Solimonas fluminis TaxID=2086571 RepID=A0A2S5TF04_9GAMM|nr:nitronate monooxygenase [Solimonas fluminis]PPE73564.1 2-nitropropane dioxygenase [Solimonas fluminis]